MSNPGVRIDLTAVPGFRAGSAEDLEALTGCTVVLAPPGGAIGGCVRLGGATGTRELDPLTPDHLVERCHAILLSGGSAFGLDAAGGVMRHLEERGIGFPTRAARVPIVPCAIVYDLGLGRPDVRPDAAMARRACLEAEANPPLRQGNAGAGTGATVGKILGPDWMMKGGLGSAVDEVRPGILVGVIAVVNAFGDVLETAGGSILAGARTPSGGFADTKAMLRRLGGISPRFGEAPENTVLAVVATNARLTKAGAQTLARLTGTGLARIVSPAQTQVDGDLVFALAAGDEDCDPTLLGIAGADLLEQAIVRAVREAVSVPGVPAVRDLAGADG